MLKSAIKVYARIKPTLDYNSATHPFIIQQESNKNDEKERLIIKPYFEARNLTQCFSFKLNRIFPPNTCQSEFYESVGRPVVNRLLSGYNGAIFAFGQTGTGKTHAIIGDLNCDISKGLISRVFDDIFTFITNNPSFKYNLSISSIEIYNEVCYDLITLPDDKGISFSRVTIMEDSKGNIKILNLKKYKIFSMDDVMNYLKITLDNRVVADTPMNKISSRSHFIFTLYLDQKSNINGVILNSKLHLIDLAGSERLSKRKNPGFLFHETKSINLSLHYLEQVIVALNSRKRSHVPYRNSFLTSLLRDSLGGNCCTAMIVTISLEIQNINETIATCKFAERVSLIKNEPRISYQYNEKQSMVLNINQETKKSIIGKNFGKSEQKFLQTANNENIPNLRNTVHEETMNTEYLNYTIDHINRGIKLLSTLLNQVPHLLKNFFDCKEDLSEKITNSLGLKLPQVNPFTGKHYDQEQKSAFKKFLSTEATNKALLKYLEMNITYYKYLEIDWNLWNKEMNIVEKIRETELKMKSAQRYGDFPEVIEKLNHTYDKYVEKNRINKQECQSIQEKKQKNLKLFMDARKRLFQAFEIWWPRHKELNKNISSKDENNLPNNKYFTMNTNSIESDRKKSMNIGLSSQTLKRLDEESKNYQINFPIRSNINSKVYSTLSSKTNAESLSPISPTCITPNSTRDNLKNVNSNSPNISGDSIFYARNFNTQQRQNYENKHLSAKNKLIFLDNDQRSLNNQSGTNENCKIKSPSRSKHSPMLFSLLKTSINSKYQSPVPSKCITPNSTRDNLKNFNSNSPNISKRNSNIHPISNNANKNFDESEENNSTFLDNQMGTIENYRTNSPFPSKNRPMLSIFRATEHLSPKSTSQSSASLTCSINTQIARRSFTSKVNDSMPETISNSYLENNVAINSPTPIENHGENMSSISSITTTRGPMLRSTHDEGKDEPVKLKLTGDEDLDSRILSFYKSHHVSVIF